MPDAKPALGVGLVGLGTIGTGVVRAFQDHGALIDERLGFPLELRRIADIETQVTRQQELQGGAAGLVLQGRDGIDAEVTADERAVREYHRGCQTDEEHRSTNEPPGHSRLSAIWSSGSCAGPCPHTGRQPDRRSR